MEHSHLNLTQIANDPDPWHAAPLTKGSKLAIKLYVFGAAGLVGALALALLIYVVFFRRKHGERKIARAIADVRFASYHTSSSSS